VPSSVPLLSLVQSSFIRANSFVSSLRRSRYARSTIQPLLYGTSECIDRLWLNQRERERAMLLEWNSCIPLSTNTILPCIYIFHSIHYQEQLLCNAAYSVFVHQYRNTMTIMPTLSALCHPSWPISTERSANVLTPKANHYINC